MKKLISIALAIAVVSCSFLAGEFYNYRYGRNADLNHDGQVNAKDLSILLGDWTKK